MVKNHTRGDQLTWIGKEVGVGQFSGINSLDVKKKPKRKKEKEKKEKKKPKEKEKKEKGMVKKKETPTRGAKTSHVPAVNAS